MLTWEILDFLERFQDFPFGTGDHLSLERGGEAEEFGSSLDV